MIKYNNLNSPSFEGFKQIFEDSSLAKTGIPKAMITAIHTKDEHFSGYNRMGHMYRRGYPQGIEYKHYKPAHDVTVADPIVLIGRKSNISPYTGKEIRSRYTDFSWFLESLEDETDLENDYETPKSSMGRYRQPRPRKLGRQMRVLFVNEEHQLYLYLYNKAKSKRATGSQYAIMYWDPNAKKVIDFGFSELTRRAVDRREVRNVHDDKGGNTNMKIQEFIRSITMDGRIYAPSPSKPLKVYKIEVDTSGETEPATKRKGRSNIEAIDCNPAVRLFASRYIGLFKKLSKKKLAKVQAAVDDENMNTSREENIPSEIVELASVIGCDAAHLHGYLYSKMVEFRVELFDEGRLNVKDGKSAYDKSSGFNLESEIAIITDLFHGSRKLRQRLEVEKKDYLADEENLSDEERKELEDKLGHRKVKPESTRKLPLPGDIASIPSIIKKHTLDGFLRMYTYFLLTGSITGAVTNVESLMGIKDDEKDAFKTSGTGTEDWYL